MAIRGIFPFCSEEIIDAKLSGCQALSLRYEVNRAHALQIIRRATVGTAEMHQLQVPPPLPPLESEPEPGWIRAFNFRYPPSQLTSGMAELRYLLLQSPILAQCRARLEAANCPVIGHCGAIILVHPTQCRDVLRGCRGMKLNKHSIILTGGFPGSPAFWCDVFLRTVPYELRPRLAMRGHSYQITKISKGEEVSKQNLHKDTAQEVER